jgi:hypothetical protein
MELGRSAAMLRWRTMPRSPALRSMAPCRCWPGRGGGARAPRATGSSTKRRQIRQHCHRVSVALSLYPLTRRSRAPRPTPPALGAGCGDGRAKLRGRCSMAAGCCAQRYSVTWRFRGNALRQKGKRGIEQHNRRLLACPYRKPNPLVSWSRIGWMLAGDVRSLEANLVCFR